MKMKYVLLMVFALLITACSIKKQIQKTSNVDANLDVKVVNLSENFTTLATQNDEIFILVIQGNIDSANLVYKTYTIFDYDKSVFSTKLSLKKFVSDDMLAVILIEEDTGISINSLSEKVMKNFAKLQSAYQNKDYASTYDVLGDDDLLGIAVFTKKELYQKEGTNLTIKGSRLLDKYSYSVYIHQ